MAGGDGLLHFKDEVLAMAMKKKTRSDLLARLKAKEVDEFTAHSILAMIHEPLYAAIEKARTSCGSYSAAEFRHRYLGIAAQMIDLIEKGG